MALSAIDWPNWEELIRVRGLVIDRPRGSAHPRFPCWSYPVDYGYVPGTVGGDGREVDAFAGEFDTGLVGVVITRDDLKGDDEIKLLWNLSEAEVAAIEDFLGDGGIAVELIRRDEEVARNAIDINPII